MPLRREQCDAWRAQGDTALAQATLATIGRALAATLAHPGAWPYDIYLHGPFSQRTNIPCDATIDAVVEMAGLVFWEGSRLPPRDRAACEASLEPSGSALEEFDGEVQHALRSAFGFGRHCVDVGNRCITVRGGSGRLATRLIVAAHFRSYRRFRSIVDQQYVSGIILKGRGDRAEVIAYPEIHDAHGARKDRETHGEYIPAVRMVRHAAAWLIEQEHLPRDAAPSALVESLLFNVPNGKFVPHASETFYNIIAWLECVQSWVTFVRQDGQQRLFGCSPGQWNLGDARAFHAALVRLWSHGPAPRIQALDAPGSRTGLSHPYTAGRRR